MTLKISVNLIAWMLFELNWTELDNDITESNNELTVTEIERLLLSFCIITDYFSYYTLKMVLYSTKSGSWLVIIGETLLLLYTTTSLKVLCRTIRGAILHCIYSTKMVLDSTNSGSLACKEPWKGLNRFFVWQWCYIAPKFPKILTLKPFYFAITSF